MEEWREVEDFPDYYVSTYGDVRSGISDRLLTQSLVQYNMPTVGLMRDGRQYRRSTAILVAQAFLPPPERDDFNTPIHLDGYRVNCRADNLAWRPRWFAINYHNERKRPPFPNWKQRFLLVETGEVFDHPSEAATKYGILERDIRKSIRSGVVVFPHWYRFQEIA